MHNNGRAAMTLVWDQHAEFYSSFFPLFLSFYISSFSLHFYNYLNKRLSSVDRSAASKHACRRLCTKHIDCVYSVCVYVSDGPRVYTWMCVAAHVGMFCLCAVCALWFPPGPRVSGSGPISGLLSGMWQKAAGSSGDALMKPGPWLIGDTVAWGNERGSNQTGRTRGEDSGSGPRTIKLGPSCSFVEHTEGGDTYTLLIKILQMQNSPLVELR